MATSMMLKSSSTKLQHNILKLLLCQNNTKSVRVYCTRDDKSDFFGIPEDFKLQHVRHDTGERASAKLEKEMTDSEYVDWDGVRRNTDPSIGSSKLQSPKSNIRTQSHLVEEYHSKQPQHKSSSRRERRKMKSMMMDRAQKVSNNYQTHFGMVYVDRSGENRPGTNDVHQTLSPGNIFQVISKTKSPPEDHDYSDQNHQRISSSSPNLKLKSKAANIITSSRRNKHCRDDNDGQYFRIDERKWPAQVSVASRPDGVGSEVNFQGQGTSKVPAHTHTSSKDEDVLQNNVQNNHENNIFDEYYFPELSSGKKSELLETFQKTCENSLSPRNDDRQKNTIQNSSKSNLFDDYYFPELSSETRSVPAEDFQKPYKSTQSSSRLDGVHHKSKFQGDSENNLFDEYYFPELSSDKFQPIEDQRTSNGNEKNDFNPIDEQYFHQTDTSTPGSSVFSDFVSAYDINKDSTSDLKQEPIFGPEPVFAEMTKPKRVENDENANVISNRKFLFKKKCAERQQSMDSTSAFDLAMKIRTGMKEAPSTPIDTTLDSSQDTPGLSDKASKDSKGFQILSNQTSEFHKMPSMDVLEMLKKSVVFNHDDFLVIDKPYGLPSIGQANDTFSLSSLLPAFGKILPRKYKAADLHLVQALDRDVSGNVILAKNPEVAYMLKGQFKANEVIQRYWAITKGVPSPREGIIDIPIGEGKVGNVYKMVLRPEFSTRGLSIGKKTSRAPCERAVTEYKVLSSHLQTALVECRLHTSGIKHQARVHLSNGLNTPILGDHKYSHFSKMAPQKLDRSILEMLQVRQAKVRQLSLHLHCHTLVLPDYKSRTFVITSHLPSYFAKNMKSLKLYIPRK